jgi:hypothetical protein
LRERTAGPRRAYADRQRRWELNVEHGHVWP